MTTRGILHLPISSSPARQLTVIPPNDARRGHSHNTTAWPHAPRRRHRSAGRSTSSTHVDIQHTSRRPAATRRPRWPSAFPPHQVSRPRAPTVRATFCLDAPTVTPLDVLISRPAAGEWKLNRPVTCAAHIVSSAPGRCASVRRRCTIQRPSGLAGAILSSPAVERHHRRQRNRIHHRRRPLQTHRPIATAALVFTSSGQYGCTNFARCNWSSPATGRHAERHRRAHDGDAAAMGAGNLYVFGGRRARRHSRTTPPPRRGGPTVSRSRAVLRATEIIAVPPDLYAPCRACATTVTSAPTRIHELSGQ